MRYFFLSFLILFLATGTVLALPFGADYLDNVLVSAQSKSDQHPHIVQVPQTEVMGVETQNQNPISHNITVPQITAKAVLVKDLDTGFVFYSKNPDQRVPIASTTKLMTALVAIHYYQPETVLLVPYLIPNIGSNMGLVQGETITFHSLLYGLLLNSGNDAAFTMAENYPGGMSAFISEMNNEAHNLGLKNTSFDNPVGYDSLNHFSSADDLAVITQEALKNETIAKVVRTKSTTVTSLDGKIVHNLVNLNKLLNKEGVIGVKTGYTPEAKENLVGLIDKNGHRVLTVVLGSDDRFTDTEKLIDWTYQNFTWSQ